MKTRSLTRVLTGGVLLANFICTMAFSAVATLHEMHGRRRAFDITLQGRADSLLAAVQQTKNDEGLHLVVDRSKFALPRGDAYEINVAPVVDTGRREQVLTDGTTPLPSADHAGYFSFNWQARAYRALRQDRLWTVESAQGHVVPQAFTVLYASPTADLQHEAIEAARFYAITSAAFLVVVAAVLLFFLSRRLSPLQDLAASAGRVSAHSWEFVTTDATMRTLELQPIVASIRKLLAGLQSAFDRQRRFTGDAAHELKTSIAVLKSSLQLLSLRQRTVEDYGEGLRSLLGDVQRMELLVEQMLTLARLEQDETRPMEVIDLSAAVRGNTERLQSLAVLAHIHLRVETTEPHFISIAKSNAEILCSNLVMNALQHSPPGASVRVCVVPAGDAVEFRVCDSGAGIPAESLPHIFERFYRADASRSRKSGGTGLGLAICKAIVEGAGGTIEVSSKPEQGTEVRVKLPSADVTDPQL